MSGALAGRRIVVPETRELDLLARLLERYGATTVRCPLVAIRDVPDPAPVNAWLRRFVEDPPNDLILLTGEGLERLVGFAQRLNIEAAFTTALGHVRKVVRGPKPAARLRALGLKPDLAAEQPTTAGVIATLSGESISGRRIAVQLYPGSENTGLLDFLRKSGAEPDPVLCYLYASEAESDRVLNVIDDMAAGGVDLIAFTSSPQVRRLCDVTTASKREAVLHGALQRARIAVVGPIVAQAVEEAGGRVSIMPSENFHMKPMVNAIVEAFG